MSDTLTPPATASDEEGSQLFLGREEGCHVHVEALDGGRGKALAWNKRPLRAAFDDVYFEPFEIDYPDGFDAEAGVQGGLAPHEGHSLAWRKNLDRNVRWVVHVPGPALLAIPIKCNVRNRRGVGRFDDGARFDGYPAEWPKNGSNLKGGLSMVPCWHRLRGHLTVDKLEA